MTPELFEHLTQLVNEAAMLAIWLSAPPIAAAFIAGLVTGAGQTAAQIQDPAISAGPRMAAVYASIVLASPWIGAQAIALTETAFRTIALV